MKLKVEICCVIDVTGTDGLYPCNKIVENILQDEMLRDDISGGLPIVHYGVNVTEVTND